MTRRTPIAQHSSVERRRKSNGIYRGSMKVAPLKQRPQSVELNAFAKMSFATFLVSLSCIGLRFFKRIHLLYMVLPRLSIDRRSASWGQICQR